MVIIAAFSNLVGWLFLTLFHRRPPCGEIQLVPALLLFCRRLFLMSGVYLV